MKITLENLYMECLKKYSSLTRKTNFGNFGYFSREMVSYEKLPQMEFSLQYMDPADCSLVIVNWSVSALLFHFIFFFNTFCNNTCK